MGVSIPSHAAEPARDLDEPGGFAPLLRSLEVEEDASIFRDMYRCLHGVSPRDFAWHVAIALQEFSPSSDLSYPPFLLHGITQPTLERVVAKIQNNSRIIRETLTDNLIFPCIPETISDTLSLRVSREHEGLVYTLEKDYSAVAWADFFVDTTHQDLYVFTLQEKGMFGMGEERAKSLREYHAVGNILGMGPRRYLLTRFMEVGRKNGFNRICVVRPEGHPLFLGRYNGFFEHYISAVKKAGIVDECSCYLEKKL